MPSRPLATPSPSTRKPGPSASRAVVPTFRKEPPTALTLRTLEHLGLHAHVHDHCGQTPPPPLQIPPRVYPSPPPHGTYAIEPDASNASYFLAAAAIIPGSSITIPGLSKSSLQ